MGSLILVPCLSVLILFVVSYINTNGEVITFLRENYMADFLITRDTDVVTKLFLSMNMFLNAWARFIYNVMRFFVELIKYLIWACPSFYFWFQSSFLYFIYHIFNQMDIYSFI